MKMSFRQMIAIVCILALGFLTAAPIVETVDAHGDKHSYTVMADVVEVGVCETCGYHIYYKGTNMQLPVVLTHLDGEEHAKSATTYIYVPKDEEVCRCSWGYYSSS